MSKFIAVHENGKERLVNTHWVEDIWEHDGRAMIYLAFQNKETTEQDHIWTDEKYEDVKGMVMGD